jgi:hypothetical protein
MAGPGRDRKEERSRDRAGAKNTAKYLPQISWQLHTVSILSVCCLFQFVPCSVLALANSSELLYHNVLFSFAYSTVQLFILRFYVWYFALQRGNTENSKQIFPEKEFCGLSPIFPHSCVCERFIYSQDRFVYSAAGKYVDRFWEYINRS